MDSVSKSGTTHRLAFPTLRGPRNRLLGVGFHAEKREGVRDPAFRSLPSKIQEELAGTRFETLSNIYDKVGVEEMRAAMEQVNQAVSGLN